MNITNTYVAENGAARLERQAEIHRRCILLLRTMNERRDAR